MSTNGNDRSGQTLKSALEQQLAKETLADIQLGRLMAMQHTMLNETSADNSYTDASTDAAHPVADIVASTHSRRIFLPTLAASLLLLVMCLWWQQHSFSSRFAAGDSVRVIAMEVVKNHLKLRPLEVETNSMVEVQDFFDQLDFLPQRSATLAQQFLLGDDAMLGGRYCSIKGVTAAQLRYRGVSTEISTLYEVGYDPSLFGVMPDVVAGEEPLDIMIKGLQVSLWQEQGLLMVLVHNPAQ
jgi:hypothetical protein